MRYFISYQKDSQPFIAIISAEDGQLTSKMEERGIPINPSKDGGARVGTGTV